MRTSTHRRLTALAGATLAATLAAGCGAGDTSGDSSGQAHGPVAPGPNGAVDGYSLPEPNQPESQWDSGMTDPAADALSTFALDIDTGSYTRFRDATNRGIGLPPNEIRTEEFVNYFQQDYPAPPDGVDVTIDAAALPFQPEHRIVRVGIRSADASSETRQDADLSLVVDCSGSMAEAGKMETTKAALRTLAASLRPTDRVAMVCYSETAAVTLEPTPAADRQRVQAAIETLRPQASTNAAAGLALGYDLARAMHSEGRMNRVVLVSDGVANVGETTPGGILERITTEARAGTNLVTVGVGMQNYNDELLEQLADRGDGWHVYVDTQAEADKVFATGLTGSLVVTARDAKAQVQFDPQQVAGYRLIGYENRAVADGDFRNDAVDGGEVFAGHSTTALYDVSFREGASRTVFVTATVRYLDESGQPVERTRRLADADRLTDLASSSPRLHQDLVIAMLTDHLVGGPWSQWVGPEQLRTEAARLASTLDGDADVAELVGLIDRATA